MLSSVQKNKKRRYKENDDMRTIVNFRLSWLTHTHTYTHTHTHTHTHTQTHTQEQKFNPWKSKQKLFKTEEKDVSFCFKGQCFLLFLMKTT